MSGVRAGGGPQGQAGGCGPLHPPGRIFLMEDWGAVGREVLRVPRRSVCRVNAVGLGVHLVLHIPEVGDHLLEMLWRACRVVHSVQRTPVSKEPVS